MKPLILITNDDGVASRGLLHLASIAQEFGEVMARQLGSPKAIDRMTSYVYQAKPRTEEMLVDEMLAICEEINTWRKKKASQEAQEKYNAYLFSRR